MMDTSGTSPSFATRLLRPDRPREQDDDVHRPHHLGNVRPLVAEPAPATARTPETDGRVAQGTVESSLGQRGVDQRNGGENEQYAVHCGCNQF